MATESMDGREPADGGVADSPDALAAAEAEIRAGGDEGATAICLRCFAPLDGAPTRCANCGAPASRAATLGPSAGGGVDVGGTTISTLPHAPDGLPTSWAICIVWALGLWALPYLAMPIAGLLGLTNAGSTEFWIWAVLAIGGAWTLWMATLFVRSFARARLDASRAPPPPTPDA